MEYARHPNTAPESTTSTGPYTGGECRATFPKPNPKNGSSKYKNKFTYCAVYTYNLYYDVCDKHNKCHSEGQDRFRITEVGIGTVGKQELTTSISLDNWKHIFGKVRNGKHMQLNLVCGYYQEKSKCNSNMQLGKQYTIGEWKATYNDKWLNFHFTFPKGAGDGSLGGQVDARDKVHYHETILGLGFPEYGVDHRFNARPFRCDGAKYVGTGCIFDKVAATWHLKRSAAPAAADHIKFAFSDPGTKTIPKSPGVLIPGDPLKKKAADRIPLTRNWYDTQARFKEAGKPISKSLEYKSRKKSIGMCKQVWGKNYTKGPRGVKYECDEFPFAKTYQGSATTGNGTRLWYSVLPINKTDNGTAGSLWAAWMKRDHLIDKDPFWVQIDP